MQKVIWNFCDAAADLLITAFLADATLRVYKVLREHFKYKNNYLPEQRLWQILRRCFSYTTPTLLLLLIAIGVLILRVAATGHYYALATPAPTLLAFIPLYWLLYAAGFGCSHLDYADWVRESHGLDYAAGMASSYFHGYLKLTLPSFKEHRGIRERINLYETQNRVKFAVNRLVILVPNSMFVNSKIESRILEKATPLEVVQKNRAGVLRPFKNDVYRFTIPINGIYYYVALEGATPMLTFFEAMNFKLSATWQMQEMQREIWLKFFKHLKKLLNDWPETEQEVELVLYNAYTANGTRQDVGDLLLAHITNLWQENKA